MSLCQGTPVYVGYGNRLLLIPYADVVRDKLLDMTGATRVEVCVGGHLWGSDDHSEAFDWYLDPDDEDEERWTLELRPGLLPDIPEGEHTMRVVVYDGEYLNGLVLTNDLPITVYGEC